MKTKKEAFKIIGIKVRTINKPGHADKDIPALWKQFMENGLMNKIPNKAGEEIYCVYTNYEGDHTQPYDTVLGCRVSSLDNIPEDMAGITISESNYNTYPVKGNLTNGTIIVEKWMEIWNADLDRTYAADFEVYDERTLDPTNAEVDIYIAVV